MNNNSPAPREGEQRSRGNFFRNLTRTTFTSVRRLFSTGASRLRSRRERNSRFERFLRDEFLINNTSDSEIAQHLVTIHLSYVETRRDCTIYIGGYNDCHDKVIDGFVEQDLTCNSGSECYVTYTDPRTGELCNRRFSSPFEATEIKEFFRNFLRRPEGTVYF